MRTSTANIQNGSLVNRLGRNEAGPSTARKGDLDPVPVLL